MRCDTLSAYDVFGFSLHPLTELSFTRSIFRAEFVRISSEYENENKTKNTQNRKSLKLVVVYNYFALQFWLSTVGHHVRQTDPCG